jgi:hypothetical protein
MYFSTSVKVLNSVYTEGLEEEAGKLKQFLIDHFELEQSVGTTVWLKNQWFKEAEYIKVYFKFIRKFYKLDELPFGGEPPKELSESEVPENEKWRYDEYTELLFEVKLYLKNYPGNKKCQTIKQLKQSECADVYTADGETDEPQLLIKTPSPDNKIRYCGNKADYDKEYIIVLPKERKKVVELYKKQEGNEWKSIAWLSANEPECEDPFDEKRIQAYIDLVDALYIHVRVLSPEEKKQLWHEFNKQNLQFYHYWNEICQGREEGPDMYESYGFRHYFFCQEHNVSWEQLPRDENNATASAIMDFFERHRNILDVLSKR